MKVPATSPPSSSGKKRTLDSVSECSGDAAAPAAAAAAAAPASPLPPPPTAAATASPLPTDEDEEDDDNSYASSFSYDDDDDLDSSSDDESCSEEENLMIRKIVSANLTRGLSATTLSRMVIDLHPPAAALLLPPPGAKNKRIRMTSEGGAGTTGRYAAAARKSSLPARSPSSTFSSNGVPPARSAQALPPAKAKRATVCPTTATTSTSSRLFSSQSMPSLKVIHQRRSALAARAGERAEDAPTNPDEYLRALLRREGRDASTIPASDLVGKFFIENDLSAGTVANYDMALVQAIRMEDVDELRRLSREVGRTLQCSNKFGETSVRSLLFHCLWRMKHELAGMALS